MIVDRPPRFWYRTLCALRGSQLNFSSKRVTSEAVWGVAYEHPWRSDRQHTRHSCNRVAYIGRSRLRTIPSPPAGPLIKRKIHPGPDLVMTFCFKDKLGYCQLGKILSQSLRFTQGSVCTTQYNQIRELIKSRNTEDLVNRPFSWTHYPTQSIAIKRV